jgi:hypothetical protein
LHQSPQQADVAQTASIDQGGFTAAETLSTIQIAIYRRKLEHDLEKASPANAGVADFSDKIMQPNKSMIPKSCRLFGQDHATEQLLRAKSRFAPGTNQ